jgi:hypothetical protein
LLTQVHADIAAGASPAGSFEAPPALELEAHRNVEGFALERVLGSELWIILC